jgi:hypothetical protein
MEPGLDPDTVLTLEAFADTIVPGNKRFPEDRAIAGESADGGAVAAGALDLLQSPAGGVAQWLPALAQGLNAYAQGMFGASTDESVPPFVALSYDQRVALVQHLTTQDTPERQGWVNLAVFSNMAFDSAAHLHTAEALESGHPGLHILGFAPPDRDGRWRFPQSSYGRALSKSHPETTPAGNPS